MCMHMWSGQAIPTFSLTVLIFVLFVLNVILNVDITKVTTTSPTMSTKGCIHACLVDSHGTVDTA